MGTYTHQTKRCPKCGKVYENRTVSGPYGSEALYKFGKIFVTCPSCGATFRDSDTYELAIMDPPREMITKFHISNIIIASLFGIIGLVVLFTGAAASPWGVLLFCLIFGGGILWGDYRRYSNNMARIETERAQSIKRLKNNPDYVMLLKAAGFTVPDEYLPKKEE